MSTARWQGIECPAHKVEVCLDHGIRRCAEPRSGVTSQRQCSDGGPLDSLAPARRKPSRHAKPRRCRLAEATPDRSREGRRPHGMQQDEEVVGTAANGGALRDHVLFCWGKSRWGEKERWGESKRETYSRTGLHLSCLPPPAR